MAPARLHRVTSIFSHLSDSTLSASTTSFNSNLGRISFHHLGSALSCLCEWCDRTLWLHRKEGEHCIRWARFVVSIIGWGWASAPDRWGVSALNTFVCLKVEILHRTKLKVSNSYVTFWSINNDSNPKPRWQALQTLWRQILPPSDLSSCRN